MNKFVALGVWMLGCAPVSPKIDRGDVHTDPVDDSDTVGSSPESPTEDAPSPDPSQDDEGCTLTDGRLPATETDYIQQGTAITDTRPRCTSRIHATAGAKNIRTS